mgnify:FL=1
MRDVAKASSSVLVESSRRRVEAAAVVAVEAVLMLNLKEMISDLALRKRESAASGRGRKDRALLGALLALGQLAFEMGEVSLAGGGAEFKDGRGRAKGNEVGLLLLESGDPGLGGRFWRSGLEGRKLLTKRGEPFL